MGLPVIGTQVGGVPETMMPGRSGLLVPPNDPGALAQALDLLLGDAALRRRMGEAGRGACATWACSRRRAWRRTWKTSTTAG